MMRFNVGSATVTVFNTGDLRADLADWFGVRAEDWPQYASVLAQPARVPMNAVHIALGEASVLVDAPRWHESIGTEFLLPGYTPPQDLPEQMRAAGIAPDAVTHVVITHAHFDHFSGLLDKTGNLAFPNAWHYIGRADWDAKLRDANGEARAIFAALDAHNALMRVGRDLVLADGITVLAAPGETPGHQIVRVQSGGQSLYVIGDLYHHEIEFVEPEWNVTWADARKSRISRALFVTGALAEDAYFITGHIRGIGQFQRATNEAIWRNAH